MSMAQMVVRGKKMAEGPSETAAAFLNVGLFYQSKEPDRE